MQNKVKCRDCGLIAMRLKETRQLSEVELPTRDRGDIPCGPTPPADPSKPFSMIAAMTGGPWLYDPLPSCVATAHDLEAEFERHKSTNSPGGSLKIVLHESRSCQHFTKWRPGFSPQEHLAMRDMERDRAQQRRENRINLAVAILGPLVVSIFAAWINSKFSGPAVIVQQVAPAATSTTTGR